ncbi:VOC family protein [Umezawaea beigongshangensis]|uniref:VOC family protein n=1 Tax=Umezawaea beigongshangensis TaxID=2780383 RepID=UPI0018F1D936|nr:VOC family protein [Umezawaea beigongshangensis]
MTLSPNPPAPADLLPGGPCWLELPVTDPRSARDFYAGLFGWTYELDRGHPVALVDGVPVAGLPPTDRFTPWTLYLLSPHVRATAERAYALGGAVLRNPAGKPDRTRSTLIRDPTGGVVGFRHVPPDWRFGTGGHGAFAWAELNTRRPSTADVFFQELCHFDVTQIGDGHRVDYTLWSVRGRSVLGRQRMGRAFEPTAPPHWMVYFTASPEVGTDSVADQVLRLGGRVCVEPYDSPQGRVTVVEDTSGATFSVIDPSRALVLSEDETGAGNDDPYDD